MKKMVGGVKTQILIIVRGALGVRLGAQYV